MVFGGGINLQIPAREDQLSAKDFSLSDADGLPALVYHQSSGHIQTPAGDFVAIGWAGNGIGKNNPSMQGEHNVGPLPRGSYQVQPWEDEHPGLGPVVARLLQCDGETYGRSGFFCHGPSKDITKFGQESEGCIVIPLAGRMAVKALAPAGSILRVVA
jgi:hypothetical protein